MARMTSVVACGAGIATAADNQGNEESQDDGTGNFVGKIAHGGGSEHFTEKQNGEPAGALAHHLREGHFHVRTFERFHTADFQNVFAGFLLDDAGQIGALTMPSMRPC